MVWRRLIGGVSWAAGASPSFTLAPMSVRRHSFWGRAGTREQGASGTSRAWRCLVAVTGPLPTKILDSGAALLMLGSRTRPSTARYTHVHCVRPLMPPSSSPHSIPSSSWGSVPGAAVARRARKQQLDQLNEGKATSRKLANSAREKTWSGAADLAPSLRNQAYRGASAQSPASSIRGTSSALAGAVRGSVRARRYRDSQDQEGVYDPVRLHRG